MATGSRSSVDRVEEQRLRLEENVAKFRKALQHWQTWDAEYEGVKEEVLGLGDEASQKEIEAIGPNFGGELVNEREIRDLFGLDKGPARKPSQIARLVERRQDYVQQNIRTISNQLRSAETALGDYLNEDIGEEAGSGPLPISEIYEELDDYDNVISSQVTHPEADTARIVETLKKAGVTDLAPNDDHVASSGLDSAEKQTSNGADTSTDIPAKDTAKNPSKAKRSALSQVDSPSASGIPSSDKPTAKSDKGGRKSVSFAPTVSEVSIPARDSASQIPRETPPPSKSSLIPGSFDSGARVIEIDDDDEIIGATPLIPNDESPDDARLRREMLEYSLNEVGSVVAELDLDETYSDDDHDYEDDLDMDEEGLSNASDLSEDEDEHGRTKGRVLSNEYRQEMMELEARLQARMIENIGPDPSDDDPDIDPNELKRLVIRHEDEAPVDAQAPKDKAKKNVRFAEDIDVQPAKRSSGQSTVAPVATPLSDSITERSTDNPKDLPMPDAKPQKMSRFKQAKSSSATASSQSPSSQSTVSHQTAEDKDQVLLDKVMERSSTERSNTAPEVDEFNHELQQRQLASEYYRMRNNMIRQQGGFKASEEDIDQPLMEERDGKVKKYTA